MAKLKRVCIFLAVVLLLNLVNGLSITPAKHIVDFESATVLNYDFTVRTSETQRIELYTNGPFSEYVEFDKTEFVGTNSFNVKINLPIGTLKYGENRLIIGAREIGNGEDNEEIGTSVAVQVPIYIVVPYPGKYAEISFSASNANQGEDIKFVLDVYNKGSEDIVADSSIKILNIAGEEVDELYLGAKEILSKEDSTFKKNYNTEELLAGDYNAVAIVDYRVSITKEERKFRIGQLYVNVTGHSNELIKKDIQPFEIYIESLWNDPINNVFAKVVIYDDGEEISTFLTPSVNLGSWDTRTLIGFIDTNELKIGNNDIKIILGYDGGDGEVESRFKLLRNEGMQLYVYVLIGVLVLGVIVGLIIFFRNSKLRRGNNGKKK